MIDIEQEIHDSAMDVVGDAIASGDTSIVLIVVVAFIIIPLSFAFVLNLKKQKESQNILDNQKVFLDEQREVNSIILKQLRSNVNKETFSTLQIIKILSDLILLMKYELINETRITITMNNLVDKEKTIHRIKTFSRNIVAKQFDKLGWYTFKGVKCDSLISEEWYNIPESTIINYIYSNQHATEDVVGDKSNYFDFRVLERDLEISLDVITNYFAKRLNNHKSLLEEKLEEYE